MTALQSRNSAERLRRMHARRKGLLLSCALGSGVALALPGAAQAQAFRGTPNFNPNITRTITSGQTETIRVNQPRAVIDWNPLPDANPTYDFLPQANTATFEGAAGFAVLNRINTTVPIELNGHVISQVVDPLTGAATTGGTVLFSAPSGIIVGANAVFDVGSLVLTTLGVNAVGGADVYGNFEFINPDGSIGFSGTGGGIQTAAGSQINANSVAGSYVALVAPTIDHGGSILVNGSAALLGAGLATLNPTPGQFRVSTNSDDSNSVLTRPGSTIRADFATNSNVALVAPNVNHQGAIRVDGQAALVAGRGVEISLSVANGLFNIAVPDGAPIDGPTPGGLTSTGSITGPASTPASGPHAIYLVAVPQAPNPFATRPPLNEIDPITVLLGGTIGFDPPGAGVVDGQIVISSGYEISDGAINDFPTFQNEDGAYALPGPSNIVIHGGAFTSNVVARSYGSFRADTDDSPLDFSGNLDVVSAGGYFLGDYTQAGYITFGATAGRTARVRGNLSLTAAPGVYYAEGEGENATGGIVDIFAGAGSSVIVTGDATLDARATGYNSGYNGGYGLGGRVSASTSPTGTIQIGGDLSMLASGTGGRAEGGTYAAGGRGAGGNASLYADGGAITVGGNLLVDVSGTGGAESGAYGGYGAPRDGATGTGGTVGIDATEGGTVTVSGGTSIEASGQGGTVTNTNYFNPAYGGYYDPANRGGIGQGGAVTIRANDGGISLAGELEGPAIDVSGIGGNGPTGGGGTGGTARIFTDPLGGTIGLGGDFDIDATGLGGNGGLGDPGDGGTGQGGLAYFNAGSGGAITIGNARVDASGLGGGGDNGGDGIAGDSPDAENEVVGGAFLVAQGGTLTATGEVDLIAQGVGADADNGDGGDGTGGTAQFDALNAATASTLTVASGRLETDGRGGNGSNGVRGGNGGNATAGTTGLALAETGGGNTLQITGNLFASANAFGGAGGIGGDGPAGAGGNATGGFLQFGTSSGNGAGTAGGTAIFGSIDASASATGGAGGTGAGSGAGGDGTAGVIALLGRGGAIQSGDINFFVDGTGGDGGAGAAGGDGLGGEIDVLLTPRAGGTVGTDATIGTFIATADGTAGAGATPGTASYGGFGIVLDRASATFAAVVLAASGADPVPAIGDTSLLQVTSGDFNVTGGFSIATPGAFDAELDRDNSVIGSMTVSTPLGITINALTTSFQVTGDAAFSAFTSVAGAATGTAVTINADNSSFEVGGTLAADASARGTAGGTTGGTITIGSTNNSVVSAGAVALDASGTGIGPGAFANGGTISVTAGANSGVSLGAGTVDASGTGGDGGAQPGGFGAGGTISFVALPGGTIGLTDTALVANGLAGSGGGGDGAVAPGGTVQLIASGGTLDLQGTVSLGAVGIGGDGGPFTGGLGTGGQVLVSVSDGTLTFDQLVLDASGRGGSGGTGGTGIGGFSPDGEVGSGALFLIDGGTVNGNGLTMIAAGTGGDGLGNVGGLGVGGTVRIAASDAATPNNVTIAEASLDASGFGGAGGSGSEGEGEAGGDGDGGTVSVLASNGDFAITTLSASATARGGQGGTGSLTPAGGAPGGAGGAAAAGAITFGTGGDTGAVTFGSVSANVVATGGTGGAPGDGGVGGNGGDAFAGSVTLVATGGSIDAGDIQLLAEGDGGGGGDGGIGGDGSGGIAGTDIGGGATVAIDSLGASVSGIGGPGAAIGAARYGQIGIGVDSSSLTLGGGSLAASGDSAVFSDPSGIFLDNGQVTLTGQLTFDIPGEIDVAGAGTVGGAGGAQFFSDRINFSDGATVNLGSLTAAATGDIVVADGTSVGATGTTSLYAGGIAEIDGVVTGAGIDISSTDIDIAATGFIGDASTDTVNLNVIPAGDADFVNQVVIGGADAGPGYTLTNDEAGRIRAGTLRISVPVTGTDAARDPDVLIRDLTLNGAPTPASNAAVGTLEIDAGGGLPETGSTGIHIAAAPDPGEGIARIEGNVLLANAGADNAILIQADGLLTLVTPDASLRVQDAAGNPTGLVGLASNNIWVASQDLLDQLAADPDFVGRDDALLANNGAEEPRGYIEGGDVQIFVRDTLFVQNTGTADTFGGITVTGDLTVTPTGTNLLEVQAFGRRLNPDGTFVTNNDFFNTVAFEQGYGGFDPAAEFNLCVIATGVCPRSGPDETIQPPTADQIEEPVAGSGDETTQPVVNVNNEFDDNSVFDSNELIEEPVTSGGDSGLWSGTGECPDNDTRCANGNNGPAGGGQTSGNPGGGSNGN